MEKEVLITIILQDIKELDTLFNTFKGKPEIPKTFLSLTKSKVKGILDEIDLLESITEPEIKHKEETKKMVEKPSAEHITQVIETDDKTIRDKKNVNDEKKTDDKIVPEIKINQPGFEIEKAEIKVAVTKKTTDADKAKQSSVLGEKLGRDTQSFNEALAQKKETDTPPRFQAKPIEDLKKGVGINDKFYFQRELFNGNMELLNQTLDQLNQMDNYKSAETFIAANFTWENNNEAAKAFNEIIRRRFL